MNNLEQRRQIYLLATSDFLLTDFVMDDCCQERISHSILELLCRLNVRCGDLR